MPAAALVKQADRAQAKRRMDPTTGGAVATIRSPKLGPQRGDDQPPTARGTGPKS
eukprot:CAMPEP_0115847262 /NCGR_PEP_ID=MMETSP0287-20121206/10292_1 /TAXON_ID=412157 /ORGANISM="Chrysochromulina rotalis, Strain UIO044" /LENGTH=54 /DNA_ID=CAMNT_0003301091 /DNA_START=162 /DNA_END=326 /DNA_ORIENTATION=-